jgi:hypothetical protein
VCVCVCVCIHAGTSSKGAAVTLYVLFSRDDSLARTLIWTPCTGQDEEVVVCVAASTWNTSAVAAISSLQQCKLIDVVATKPPVFLPGMLTKAAEC